MSGPSRRPRLLRLPWTRQTKALAVVTAVLLVLVVLALVGWWQRSS